LKALNQPCDRKTLIKKLEVKRPELLDALLEVGLAAKELAVKNERFSKRIPCRLLYIQSLFYGLYTFFINLLNFSDNLSSTLSRKCN